MTKKSNLFSIASLGILLACGFACAQENSNKPADKSKPTDPANQAVSTQTVAPTTTADQPEISKQDITRLSEMFGHFLGRSIKAAGVDFDLEAMSKGMKNGFAGTPAPMSDKDYETLMTQLQQQTFKKVSDKNLKDANQFMAKNSQEKDVKEIEPNKLQYMILQEGTGATVTDNDSPEIKYTGKFIDGTTFNSSDEVGGSITIPLKQTIPGFSKGIVGMKEGEKRRLFIHPDLGYGTSGQLPPNSLLIFDIEVVKANNPKMASASEDADSPDDLSMEDDEPLAMNDDDEDTIDEPQKPKPLPVLK